MRSLSAVESNAAATIVVLAVLTWRQTSTWHDSTTMWENAIANQPASYIAHTNLGYELSVRGRIDEAKKHYERALENPFGFSNLLNALDHRMQEGTLDPSALAPVARLMSAGAILYRADLQTDRYDLVRAAPLWRLLTDPVPAGLSAPTPFGDSLGAYRIEQGQSATQIVGTIDGNGTIAAVGDGEPTFRVGWVNNLKYGRFGLTSLLDWQQGSTVIDTRIGSPVGEYLIALEIRLSRSCANRASPIAMRTGSAGASRSRRAPRIRARAMACRAWAAASTGPSSPGSCCSVLKRSAIRRSSWVSWPCTACRFRDMRVA